MQLILFFNGWGMNETIIENLSIDSSFKLICINFPYKIENIDFKIFTKIYVIGWSFGVSYAAEFLANNPTLNCFSIAINGHTDIIGKFGISPKMFKLTLETLNESNFKKFFLNMGCPLNLFPNTIDINYLKYQLEIFSNRKTYTKIKFNKIILGNLDRIIPYSKQIKFYENYDNVITLNCNHYPFDKLNTWRKIISETPKF